MTPSTTQSDALEALRAFLVGILPSGVEVLQAQGNRVPEPEGDDFVVMTPIDRMRLSTNVETAADCAFMASVAGNVMTVSSVSIGTILVGATLLGSNLSPAPTITGQDSGTPGGTGVYRISSPQLPISLQQMATGVTQIEQDTQFSVQLDVHGGASADNAQTISTLMRSAYAVDNFAAGTVPLYADDPRQIAFVNDQNQYENRWIVEALLQVNPVVSVPQQFADAISVDVVSVDEAYPP